MKFISILTALALAGLTSAAVAHDAESMERAAASEGEHAKRDLMPGDDLTARDCSYDTICHCDGRPAGKFCGKGAAPRNGWCLRGYIYQCDGKGNTCRYGPRDSCK